MIFFEFLDGRGRGVLTEWRSGLEAAQQAQLDEKIKSMRAEPLLIDNMLFSVKGYPKIRKLKIGGKVRLRPLLCRGPQDVKAELTLLAGATERDWKFDPPGAPATAELNRQSLVKNPARRGEYDEP